MVFFPDLSLSVEYAVLFWIRRYLVVFVEIANNWTNPRFVSESVGGEERMVDRAMQIPLDGDVQTKTAYSVLNKNKWKRVLRDNLEKHAEFKTRMLNNPGVLGNIMQSIGNLL